jgi:hypothetical protein
MIRNDIHKSASRTSLKKAAGLSRRGVASAGSPNYMVRASVQT